MQDNDFNLNIPRYVDTFEPEQANTGVHLIQLLSDSRTHIVTTLIHKFVAAVSNPKLKQADRNTFVLVDEGHRGQYNEQHARMRLTLKSACFIAFTGTPLAKSAKKNTFAQFGDLFRPAYTIANAVADRAVVPLLHEARHVPQTVDKKAVDGWFEKLTLALNEDQRADLKRKFFTERHLNKATRKVRMIAWDVSLHYADAYQGTGLKGQLVTPDKTTALTYKRFMDEFGMVSTEVLISAPSLREGEERGSRPSEGEKAFWQKMMNRYGSEKNYNKQLINAFKHAGIPEIIIVVDKLLTGFDAARNTVLYLARKLKEHTLLQAIARVNRLRKAKNTALSSTTAASFRNWTRPSISTASWQTTIARTSRPMKPICAIPIGATGSMSASAHLLGLFPWPCHQRTFSKRCRPRQSTDTRST